MKRILSVLILSSGLLCAGDIEIENPWIRAVPPSSGATAAFMTIANHSDKLLTVTGGSTPVAREVKPMVTTKSRVNGQEVMGMEFVTSFTVEAEKKRVLEPGGDHIMLMKLKEVPKAGAVVPLTLEIESGGRKEKITLQIPVR
ncbi:MAG: copper chaperone PCu(A)C [Verrucomicrobiaceae bacterium]|nr:MAG: copper chaperone PCu(A)C [Verrucomicrobiaceae bacterium]